MLVQIWEYPKTQEQTIDFSRKITNAVIDHFYRISENKLGISSSLSRDSNAYADTMALDSQEYPKFLLNEENNPLIKRQTEERLFPRR